MYKGYQFKCARHEKELTGAPLLAEVGEPSRVRGNFTYEIDLSEMDCPNYDSDDGQPDQCQGDWQIIEVEMPDGETA